LVAAKSVERLSFGQLFMQLLRKVCFSN